jgi:hypothetical protein
MCAKADSAAQPRPQAPSHQDATMEGSITSLRLMYPFLLLYLFDSHTPPAMVMCALLGPSNGQPLQRARLERHDQMEG